MEVFAIKQNGISPEAHVLAIEELLTIILQYATPNATKKELLSLRRVGKLWGHCANKMFNTPPLKIKLDMVGFTTVSRMYTTQAMNQYSTGIPMEITIPPNWLSKRPLIYLNKFSYNVKILNLDGVEGADAKLDEIPSLPELKTLTVNTVYNVYYGKSRISEFVKELVKRAPKLEVIKVLYDELIVRNFLSPGNQSSFPEFMTHLKADRVVAQNLEKLLEKSNLEKLEYAEIDFLRTNDLTEDISRILEQRLTCTKLKRLKLTVRGRLEDSIRVYPLANLEEFESNMRIVTFNLDNRASLSVCFPKLVKLTLEGTQLTNLTTFVTQGSKYENLKSLILRHNEIRNQHGQSDHNTQPMLRRQGRLFAKIAQHGFPATPNLVSLEFMDFPSSVTNVVVPRFFAKSKFIKDLTISVEDLGRLCDQFLNATLNPFQGTNFNRLTSLTVSSRNQSTGRNEFATLVRGPLFPIMFDLKTLTLGVNAKVERSIRDKWEKSGRKIIGGLDSFIPDYYR